ncbi:MAG TPA: hypothetical protein VGW38_23885 [Chloroflexota bacterium]|nr:hypothetical protein [Chloroflexota bacterium]
MPRANRRYLLAAGAVVTAALVSYVAGIQAAVIVLVLLLGIIIVA